MLSVYTTSDVSLSGTMIAFGVSTAVLILYDLVGCVMTARRKLSDRSFDNRLTDLERNVELLRCMYTLGDTDSESSEPGDCCDVSDNESDAAPAPAPAAAAPAPAAAAAVPSTPVAAAGAGAAVPSTPVAAAGAAVPSTPTPVAQTPEAVRHATLKRLLLNKEVHMTYKTQTFVARIEERPAAPHGYLIVYGTEEYNTPSHFSYAKKLTVNPNINSDNGWDSIYVVTGVNAKGKQTKLSLKEFIGSSSQE